MAGRMPACGFQVAASKKGELPLKTEKRAKGKKVTIIPNVTGDATKLARSLQALLGTGGTARAAEKGFWSVEVQGDQIERVTKALGEFNCVKGLCASALEKLKGESSQGNKESVVARTAASKYLAQGAKLTAAQERMRLLDQEAEFYQITYSQIVVSDSLDDVWEENVSEDIIRETGSVREMDAIELNAALSLMGMIAEQGKAVKEFWAKSGLTIKQFQKMAMNPGARLIGDTGAKKAAPSNLISRQKISDHRGGGRRANYFSAHISAIDDHQRGTSTQKDEEKTAAAPTDPETNTTTDADGWYMAELSYCIPFKIPPSRLPESEQSTVAKRALRKCQQPISALLESIQQNIPGVACCLDAEAFGMNLTLGEHDFLFAGRREGVPEKLKPDKEELKLEKKLREISALRRKELEGAKLEKLQSEKVAKRGDLFKEVSELKLRRAEKEIIKAFKKNEQAFQDAFYELEWGVQYEDGAADGGAAFGSFDADSCSGNITVSQDGATAESRAPRWAGLRLHLGVRQGEVGAFAVKVLEGTLRLGWASPSGSVADLGTDHGGFGFGATGKKAHNGAFEAYGEEFGPGDEVHCEAERENGRLLIGFAKNNVPLGMAFAVEDSLGKAPLTGVLCGKGFKAQLVSAECLPLEDAGPGLDGFEVYDPPRPAVVARDFLPTTEDGLRLRAGETLYVSSNDGEGWMFGFFLDPDDPDDGGWFEATCVQFDDEEVTAAEDDGDNGWSPPAADWSPPPVHEAPTAVAAVASAVRAAAPSAWDDGGASDGVAGLSEWLKGLRLAQYEDQAFQWCADMGAVTLEEVLECWGDFADALQLNALERKRLADAMASGQQEDDGGASDGVPGLSEWLKGLHLVKYEDKALKWCADMGAVSLEEVLESWEDLADALQLKSLERKRLAKAIA